MNVSLPHRVLFSLLLLSGVATTDAAEPERGDQIDETVATFFRPYQHDQAALSPDGRHVALTEQLPGKPPGIVIVNLDDRSTRSYPVDRSNDHAVAQLHWVSPARLVFTTRFGAVGALDVSTGDIQALIAQRDFDGFIPEPELGARRYTSAVTPDMSADTLSRNNSPLRQLQEVQLRDAFAQERVTGDMFSSEARRRSTRVLRPFLLGAKPGSPHMLYFEVREDGDLFAYRSSERAQINIPGDVYLRELRTPEPDGVEDLGGRPALTGEMAAYLVTRRPPPLVVIELDALTGKWREREREEDWRRAWLDHQGRLRLALEQQGRRFRYLYRGSEAGKWVPLDSIVKSATPLGFSAEPASLLAPRSVPVGFDAGGEILLIATNVGRDTFGLRALNLRRGELEAIAVDHDGFDLIEPTALTAGDAVRFDPHTRALAGICFTAVHRDTRWFDPAMMQLQARLTRQLAPRRVELREWTPDRTRFLIEASAPDDPGGFFVADLATGKLIRCGDRAPWLTAERRNETRAFDFNTPDGRHLTGFLTRPRAPRLNPPPVLVYFHDGPWYSDSAQFNRGSQALAALGFAVLQLNHRGSGGLGRAHLTAIDGGLDRTVLADVQAVLERGKDGSLGINTRMAAAFGNGIGGYLAVRMAQLAPETFRCAVAINAPGDLDAWRSHPGIVPSFLADLRPAVFGTDPAKLRAQSALNAAPTTRAPVLVVHGTADTYVPPAMGRELYLALRKGSDATTYLELPDAGHGGWSEATTAKLFAELGRFFNATIYHYGVEVRKPEIVH